MSMDIAACIKQAASEKLGPLAATLIENGNFKEEGSFDIYYDLLRDELIEVLTRTNSLLLANGQTSLGMSISSPEAGRHLVTMIKVFAYGDAIKATVAQAAAPPINPSPAAPTFQPIPFHVGREPKDDPNGSQLCFSRGCGKRFATFNDAMAHKVLAHGYAAGKYTKGWAEDVVKCLPAGYTVPLSAPTLPVPGSALPAPDPALITPTNLWVPTKVLDLKGLGLASGEASRFAAGEQDTARFYFVRLLNKQTTIKGKFVWTRFAHRFNSEYVYPGDFVVRKMAGDTKEWVGLQKEQGVYNPKYNWQTKATEPKMRFENQYVGDHEADLEEILANPHKARVNYGHWRQECGYCGRNLTDAISRDRGVGPDCWEEKYLPSLRRAAQP